LLARACESNHFDIVNYLLSLGFTYEDITFNDNNILKNAIINKNIDLINFIVDKLGYTRETFPVKNEEIMDEITFPEEILIKSALKVN